MFLWWRWNIVARSLKAQNSQIGRQLQLKVVVRAKCFFVIFFVCLVLCLLRVWKWLGLSKQTAEAWFDKSINPKKVTVTVHLDLDISWLNMREAARQSNKTRWWVVRLFGIGMGRWEVCHAWMAVDALKKNWIYYTHNIASWTLTAVSAILLEQLDQSERSTSESLARTLFAKVLRTSWKMHRLSLSLVEKVCKWISPDQKSDSNQLHSKSNWHSQTDFETPLPPDMTTPTFCISLSLSLFLMPCFVSSFNQC